MQPCSTQTRRWQRTETSVQSTQASARTKAGQVQSTIKRDALPHNERATRDQIPGLLRRWMAAYGSMHGTLAGSGTVVRETAQRRNSHSHRPCATRRGDDNMRCTERLREALPTRSHEKIVRSHGSVRSHREQRAAARHMPDMGRWFSVTSIADVLGCTARQGCSGTVEIKGMDGGKTKEEHACVRPGPSERGCPCV